MYEVTMPKLSDSMEVGRIIAWKVKEGEAVHEGDTLAEVESDKAVMELECFQDGVITKIAYPDDSEVPVGETIAFIHEGGEAPAGKPEAKEPAKPEAPPVEAPAPEQAEPATAKEPAVEPEARSSPPPRAAPGRVAISPYARKLARQRNTDITQLTGSGPDGRIIARDVEAAAARPHPPQAPRAPEHARAVKPSVDEELPALDVTEDEADIEEASFRLKTQVRRVTTSKHVIPHFYITRGADVTALLQRREEIKEQYGATVTHLIMLACIKTLKKHPEINRTYDRGKIIKWKAINLGLAVDTDAGLTVVVLRPADALSLPEIVERTTALVEKARAGKLTKEERLHPGFTITNLGMFDIEHFEPIINPPSSITLAIASALETPIARDNIITIGKLMKLSAACDHRIIEGAMAARFIKDLKDLLEDPDALLGQAAS